MDALQFSFLGYKARILHPEYLLLTLAVAAAGVGLLVAWRRRVARVRGTIPERLLGKVAPGWSPARQGGRLSATLAGLVVLSLALAQPQCGTGTELAKKVGVDVVVALDVSKSMRARDIRPSRLERARLELTDLIDRLRGDRFGLVVFAGSSFVQCPLTTDYAAAKLFLRAVDPDAMPRQGTNLSQALQTARDLLTTREGSRSKVVVLLTDGEDHQGGLDEVTKGLADDGIRVFAVGIGSPAGEPIPVLAKDGSVTGYMKDRAGNTVLSRLDVGSLERLADETDGAYVQASAGGAGISEVIEKLDALEKAEFESRMTTRFEDRSALLIYPGFLLLLLGTALRPSRTQAAGPAGDRGGAAKGGSGKGGRSPKGGATAASGKGGGSAQGAPAASGAGGGAAPGHASVRSAAGGPARTLALLLLLASPLLGGAGLLESEHPQVRAGNEAYGEGSYDAALEAYDAALAGELEPGQRASVHFNRGTTLAAKGDVDGAAEAFEAALAGREGALKAKDYYNLGTAFLGSGKPDKAVEALTRSLRLDPENRAAKYNLELALRALQKQQQQDQQDPQKQGQQGEKQEQQQDSEGGKDEQKQQSSEQGRQDESGEPQQSQDDGQQGEQDRPQDQGRQEQGDDEQQADSGEEQPQDGQAQDEEEQQGGESGDEEQQRQDAEKQGEEQAEQEQPGDEQKPGEEASQGQEEEAQSRQPAGQGEEAPEPGDARAAKTLDQPAQVGEQEAEKILEALSRGEKPLQMHLFMMKKDRAKRETEEKDW